VFNVGQTVIPAGEEDCLNLNIWVPAHRGEHLLPVMIFLHGGGFKQGSGSRYDGAGLAERGAIVVTVNYRLGIFGFFAHSALTKEDSTYHSSGNYGLLDQIASLQWVQTNIRAFGGDPENVTIFGESAGANSVSVLLTSPLARGLFHRAIMQSGTPMIRRTLRQAEENGARLCSSLGCSTKDDVLQCLRDKSARELLESTNSSSQGMLGALSKPRYGPVTDGVVLPEPALHRIQAGDYSRVPIMIGVNQNEGSLFLTGNPVWSEASYEASVKSIFHDHAESLLRLYPISNYQSPRWAYDALLTDVAFRCPANILAHSVAAHENKVFVYEFRHTMKNGWARRLGAFHGLELAFVFRFGALRGLQPTHEERLLADRVADYWVQFARSGDLNGADLPRWTPYSRTLQEFQVLDIPVTAARDFGQARCGDLVRMNFPDE